MIKILRDSSHNYPWLLKSIIGLLALVFVITMGWWGFDERSGNAVADVGDLTVSRDEFKRAFEFMYRSYKEKGAGEIKEEAFKQIVVDQLIENRLWVIAARDMGITVSDTDLRDMIVQIPDFHKNGAFDPELYRRLLAANHWTPSAFEAMQQQEILAGKARLIVRDSVALTPWEIAEGQALTTKLQDPTAAPAKDRALQDMLFQKQQRALAAYQEALKAKVPTKIHRELL
ncbi:MAG: SurA N-terminal domain-containing protein [Nitrospira sp.]|nr:SurA N-terminal domain-containing protein [Nitrospira sp.]MDH4328075.1 SurA N-terminal domain-containing protein [Nitrospira sp.]MDH5252454.1 SurA N-terminal domain-containing protein [Nitrospira sp.]